MNPILIQGDCREVLAALPDATVDAIVTDPPYELGFMGKGWDSTGIAYDVGMWAECLRVLKPGGHLLSFGATRTYHRMACAVEDAGFEIRDSIMWIYGSGFPKSLDVSKAIDKAAGDAFTAKPAEGVGFMRADGRDGYNVTKNQLTRVGDSTPDAQRWAGWGTALKPAHEPIIVARKPLIGTVAANTLAHGVGGINIDGCRVGDGEGVVTFDRAKRKDGEAASGFDVGTCTAVRPSGQGRWPANVILDEPAGAELDAQAGTLKSGNRAAGEYGLMGYMGADVAPMPAIVGDPGGGASRFFYCPKAGKAERPRLDDGTAHATVKPLALMRWLVRLVTPPGGMVLDPFAGSGATLQAAGLEGFRSVGIELEPKHVELIETRLAA